MQQSTRLPVEIWERIIDFCAHDSEVDLDSQSLYACALTCRDWLLRSRMHLYDVVNLLTADHFQRFLTVIRSNPTSGTFVRELSLGFAGSDPESKEGTASKDFESTVDSSPNSGRDDSELKPHPKLLLNWICMVPLHLLPLLPKLRSVYFVDLPIFNASTQRYLSLFRSHTNINDYLQIAGSVMSCRDLAWFISCFPAVRNLTLNKVEVTAAASSPPTQPYRSHPTLTNLGVWMPSEPVLKTLLSWRSLDKIGGLVCMYESVNADLMQALILRCHSLRRVTYYLYRTAYPLPAQINLASSLQLAQLRLYLTICDGCYMTATSLPILERISLPPSITTITLAFAFNTPVYAKLFPFLGWDAFDTYCAKLPKLSGFNIFVHEAGVTKEDGDRVRETVAQHLPQLTNKGIVNVQYRSHKFVEYVDCWR